MKTDGGKTKTVGAYALVCIIAVSAIVFIFSTMTWAIVKNMLIGVAAGYTAYYAMKYIEPYLLRTIPKKRASIAVVLVLILVVVVTSILRWVLDLLF